MTKMDKIFPMARLSRMCGGGAPRLKYGLDQWLYAIPFGLVALLAGFGWSSLVAYFNAFVGKRTSHGRGMSLEETTMKPDSTIDAVERYTGIHRWLLPRMPIYYYKLIVLWLTQLVLVSGLAGAAFYYGAAYIGVAAIFASLTKPLAYVLGFSGWDRLGRALPADLHEGTAKGEYLTGLFDQVFLVTVAFCAIM